MLDLPVSWTLPSLPDGLRLAEPISANGYAVLGENWGYNHRQRGPKGVRLIEDLHALSEIGEITFKGTYAIITVEERHAPTMIGGTLDGGTISFYPACVQGDQDAFETLLAASTHWHDTKTFFPYWAKTMGHGHHTLPGTGLAHWTEHASSMLTIAQELGLVTLPESAYLNGAYATGAYTLAAPSLTGFGYTGHDDLLMFQAINTLLEHFATDFFTLQTRQCLISQSLNQRRPAAKRTEALKSTHTSSHAHIEAYRQWHPWLTSPSRILGVT